MNDNVVKQTWLDNGFLVSTISLTDPGLRAMDSMIGMTGALAGINYDAASWDYETMVFAQRDGEVTDWAELDCLRQQSEAVALTDHDALVEKYGAKVTA